MSSFVKSITQPLEEILQPNGDFIPLHEPLFMGHEWDYVKECLDTGWVSSVGKYVDLFEEKIAQTCGTRYAIAVSNGTSALHIALKIMGVGPEDEVLAPSLSFIATANAISYCGATAHFIDSEETSLGLDLEKLEKYLNEIAEIRDAKLYNRTTSKCIKAIVPMHTFGHPVDMDKLNSLAEKFCLSVVEDAAESLGSLYKKRPAGSLSSVAAVSFNGNKILTTGGGGAILTNDESLAKHAKHLTTTAKVPHRWNFYHDEIGYNYRLPNLNAALGCAQLENLANYCSIKRKLAQRYQDVFSSVKHVRFVSEPEGCESNYWLNSLILDESHEGELTNLLQVTNEELGIMTRPVWHPLHQLDIYAHCPKMDLSTTESLARRIINIPSSPSLGERCGL